MSKGNNWENGILELALNNVTFAGLGDATGLVGSTVDGSTYISLHTGDPGEAGDQSTSEEDYTGYARVAIARDGSGWTVVANSASPQAAITFGIGTVADGDTVTHFGVGTAAAGAGILLWSGTVTPNIVTGNGVTPVLPVTSTITED